MIRKFKHCFKSHTGITVFSDLETKIRFNHSEVFKLPAYIVYNPWYRPEFKLKRRAILSYGIYESQYISMEDWLANLKGLLTEEEMFEIVCSLDEINV